MKFKYCWLDDNHNKDIDQLMTAFIKETPSWWARITPLIKECRTVKDLLEKIPKEIFFSGKRFATIKRCVGMHALFQRSIMLKWPCDVYLEIEEDGSYAFRSGNTDIIIGYHHPEQAPGYLADKYAFIKPSFKVFYSTDENCLISFVDPVLYKNQPYHVCPGIIENSKNKRSELNVILLFEKGKKATYQFNSGDPMAMIQFDKKINKVEYDEAINNFPVAFTRNKIF